MSRITGNTLLFLQQSKINILARKMRSFLAILGVWIGSASVVALLYCSQLATMSVISKLSELGTNLISVSLLGSSNFTKDITVSSLNDISKKYKHIKTYSPLAFSYENVYFNGKRINANVIASNEEFYDISKLQLQAGRFISDFDQDEFCVVGVKVQAQTGVDLIGSQLKYGEHFCTVIGSLQPAKNNFFIPVDIDNSVILPIKVFQKRNINSALRDLVFSLTSSDHIAEVEGDLKTSLALISPAANYFAWYYWLYIIVSWWYWDYEYYACICGGEKARDWNSPCSWSSCCRYKKNVFDRGYVAIFMWWYIGGFIWCCTEFDNRCFCRLADTIVVNPDNFRFWRFYCCGCVLWLLACTYCILPDACRVA